MVDCVDGRSVRSTVIKMGDNDDIADSWVPSPQIKIVVTMLGSAHSLDMWTA